MASPQQSNGTTADGAKANGEQAPKNKLLEKVVREPDRLPSPQPTRLSVPGAFAAQGQPNVLHETGSGYVAPKFEGKEQQMEEVMDAIEDKGFIPADIVESETKWFYNELGIDDMYFSTESAEAIVSHIHSLYAAKVAAYARDDKKLEIRLDKEAADHAVYIDTSVPGISVVDGPRYEQRIDEKYLNGSKGSMGYRVESFRSASPLPGSQEQQLRCYFVYQCEFSTPNPADDETDLEKIGEKR